MTMSTRAKSLANLQLFYFNFFCKEVDIGLAADLGTLQKFPRIIGNDR